MTTPNVNEEFHSSDRRRYPRYYVTSRLTLAIEDESLKESIGIGEPQDISLGGVRVTNLPASPNVKVGDQLGMLLMDSDDALSLIRTTSSDASKGRSAEAEAAASQWARCCYRSLNTPMNSDRPSQVVMSIAARLFLAWSAPICSLTS